jgi:hypothetical protein
MASYYLTKPCILKPALYDAAIWFAAALFIKEVPSLFSRETSKSSTAMLYMASIPVCLLSVRAMSFLGVSSKVHYGTSTLIGLAMATWLDGAALVYFPALYGHYDNVKGPAWLLWGVGWFVGSLVL